MTQNTISGTGAMLMGAGIARLDNIYVALTLIGVGVALQITVAYLQNKGLNVQSSNLG
jgi:hypothetical protein